MRRTAPMKIRGAAAFEEANLPKRSENPEPDSGGTGLLLAVVLRDVFERVVLEEELFFELPLEEPEERDLEVLAIISRYLLFP